MPSSNLVSLVKIDNEIESAVRKSISLIGGLQIDSSDHVVLKPNLCNSKNPEGMVITDFRIIHAIVKIIKELGNEITLVESDNISDDADTRMKKTGLLKLVKKWDISYKNLSQDDYHLHEIAGVKLRLPRTVLDADYFINIPKIKTCAHTNVTLSIKNMFGVLQRSNKANLHRKLNKILPYLTKVIRNDLIIVDGNTCMEGNGPVIGTPKQLGIIVAGSNPVSVDALCSRIMGFDPSKIIHLSASAGYGLGEIKNIETIGDDWTKFKCEFEKPYRFRSTIKSLKSIKDIYF
jgi:uncharacterized protein (DUF362 family)